VCPARSTVEIQSPSPILLRLSARRLRASSYGDSVGAAAAHRSFSRKGGDSDLLSSLLAVIGGSNTTSVQASRRRLDDGLDRGTGTGTGTDGSFPEGLSAQTRCRSGIQLVKEESRSWALPIRSSCRSSSRWRLLRASMIMQTSNSIFINFYQHCIPIALKSLLSDSSKQRAPSDVSSTVQRCSSEDQET
jgi:hypothetical protein